MYLRAHPGLRAACCAAALCSGLSAQDFNWTKQSPVPTSGNIDDVFTAAPGDIWVTGQGDAHHTTDSRTWSTSSAAVAQNAVFFVDPLYGWSAGNGFAHTTDGGATWIQDNNWGTIYDLYFVDRTNGWACGNGAVAYWTDDGGLTWNAVSTGGGTTLRSIHFVDQKLGWTVGIGGEILRTTDGGRTWSLNNNAKDYLSKIHFYDAREGWAMGGDTFLHTIDGGQTWIKVGAPVNTWIHGAGFSPDRKSIVGVGQGGNIVRTTDGGLNWFEIQPMGANPGLWVAEFSDNQTVVAGGTYGVILESQDAGATWSPIHSGLAGTTYNLDAVSSSLVWAAHDTGQLLKTTDGGRAWVAVPVAGFDASSRILDVDFSSSTTGWASGIDGSNVAVVSYTNDGGATWTPQLTQSYAEFTGLFAVDDQTAVVTSRLTSTTATVWRTVDGGQNWANVSPGRNGIRDAHFVSANRGWVCGSEIYRTTDGGATWREQYSNNGIQLVSISFADATTGWAAGFQNKLLSTTDGGRTWVAQKSGAPNGTGLTGVCAVSPTEAWVVGWGGFVAHTTDGGATWKKEAVDAGTSFECVEFFGPKLGWVGGDRGIYGTTPPGPWVDLGFALAGTQGLPVLTGTGSLTAGTPVQLDTTNARPNAGGIFVIGTTALYAPFAGGTLVPAPEMFLTWVRTFGDGSMTLKGTWPPGIPPGTELYFQFWIFDPLAVQGLAATNGLEAIAQ